MSKRQRSIGIASATALFVLVGTAWLVRPKATVEGWRTASLTRGDVTSKVKATGTLNAMVSVSVGTQMSGVVTALYADFNSQVKKGQVVALIDPTVAQTQLDDALAGLRRAQAAYENAQTDLNRMRRLADQSLISASDLDGKVLAFKTAEGNLASAKASVDKAKLNLGYCTITAPVDGVVVSRVVDVGQTVAASFSTPSLFTIAQDLSRMKLQAAIDEADIGSIEVGQPATFTVDAFPGKTFQGQVTEVQLNPTVSSNVVTYQVVFEVANVPRPSVQSTAQPVSGGTARYLPAGSPVYKGGYALMPGMTANVSIQTRRHQGILRAPNMALRFRPDAAQKVQVPPGDVVISQEDGKLKVIPVRVGLTDGQFTEVEGEGLKEGLVVILGTEKNQPKTEAKTSITGGGPGGPPPGR
jgi:HlyD family secretion protein